MIDSDLWIGFFFLFGSIWGSFANVVIVRLPLNKSVVAPRSHCPQCKTAIPWYLNIPILSWILLRGRCQKCHKPIPLRYPIVEFIMGFFFAAIYARFGFSFSTIEYFIFTFGLVTSSFIDLEHMILPDRFTLSGIVLGLLGAFLNPERYFLDSLMGILLGGGLLLAVAYFYTLVRKVEGMGGGDIKLLAWIGAVCGIQSILFVLIVSSLLGLVFGLFYMFKSKQGMQTGIPFGPYLSLAALIYLIWGQDVWLNLLFPPVLS